MPNLADYRPQIEAALAYAGWSHTFEDVVEAVEAGEAQAWYGPQSIVITQLDEAPRKKILHFFLAGGDIHELEAMTPGILRWGEAQGCTVARLVGRRGWTRGFLTRTGWTDTQLVVMEKPINVSQQEQVEDHEFR